MIYADYAATTPLDEEVFEKMKPFFFEGFGNTSSVHSFGREAAKAVEQARSDIASVINGDKNEIYFTSGGTESDNWVLSGIGGSRIITSAIEHHAVLNTCERLKKNGTEIEYIPVDCRGIVNIEKLEEEAKKGASLISVMTANNETGTLQPIDEIGRIAEKYGIPFHTDAVQAVGKTDIDVKKQNISFLSMSAHKFYGPKGTGVLYIRKDANIKNLMLGGAQERDRRPGTLNTPAIVGMAEALKKQYRNREKHNAQAAACAEIIKTAVMNGLDGVILNGDENKRIAGNLNFSFEGIKSEGLLFLLDMNGIACSSGAACSAGAVKMSHVIKAIRANETNSLRISVSHLTSFDEAETIGTAIVDAVKNLRK